MRIDDFPHAWICEQHPDQPWPHPNPDERDGQCTGPGMLRPEFWTERSVAMTPDPLPTSVDERPNTRGKRSCQRPESKPNQQVAELDEICKAPSRSTGGASNPFNDSAALTSGEP